MRTPCWAGKIKPTFILAFYWDKVVSLVWGNTVHNCGQVAISTVQEMQSKHGKNSLCLSRHYKGEPGPLEVMLYAGDYVCSYMA